MSEKWKPINDAMFGKGSRGTIGQEEWREAVKTAGAIDIDSTLNEMCTHGRGWLSAPVNFLTWEYFQCHFNRRASGETYLKLGRVLTSWDTFYDREPLLVQRRTDNRTGVIIVASIRTTETYSDNNNQLNIGAEHIPPETPLEDCIKTMSNGIRNRVPNVLWCNAERKVINMTRLEIPIKNEDESLINSIVTDIFYRIIYDHRWEGYIESHLRGDATSLRVAYPR